MQEMKLRVMFANPTPKGYRVQELLQEGMSFEDALVVADREYTSDGMSLKSGARPPVMMHPAHA